MISLPDELLEPIMRLTLKHPTPLRVTPDFRRPWQDGSMLKNVGCGPESPYDDGSQLNYAILHVNRRLHRIGIDLYYSMNTFVFELVYFRLFPGAGTDRSAEGTAS